MKANHVLVLLEKEVAIMSLNPDFNNCPSIYSLRYAETGKVHNVRWARIIDGTLNTVFIPLVGWK